MTIQQRIILLIVGIITSLPIMSQDIVRLKGSVIDADNQPIELALVRIAGTTTGTTTNLEGRYELKINSAAEDELVNIMSVILLI